jgi:hypothetical protein
LSNDVDREDAGVRIVAFNTECKIRHTRCRWANPHTPRGGNTKT